MSDVAHSGLGAAIVGSHTRRLRSGALAAILAVAWRAAALASCVDIVVGGGTVTQGHDVTSDDLADPRPGCDTTTRTHVGMDVVAPGGGEGAPIRPLADGYVVKACTWNAGECSAALGNAVMLRHPGAGADGKDLYSVYLHLQAAPKVHVGAAKVFKGTTVLGFLGATAAPRGPHVHVEIRDFPDWFFPRWGNIYCCGDCTGDPDIAQHWQNPESTALCASDAGGAIGPRAVWNPADDTISTVSGNCPTADRSRYVACLASAMKAAGASADAVSVTRLLQGDAYLTDFRELGRVDLGVLSAFSYNSPELANEQVMVNGDPPVVRPLEQGGRIAVRTDARARSLLQRFPNLALWGPYRFARVSRTSGDGQRFLFEAPLMNGCRACDVVGTATLGFDFSARGRFEGAKLIGVDAGRSPN